MGDFVEKPVAPVVDLFEREKKEKVKPAEKITRAMTAEFELLVDEQLYLQHQKEVKDLSSI